MKKTCCFFILYYYLKANFYTIIGKFTIKKSEVDIVLNEVESVKDKEKEREREREKEIKKEEEKITEYFKKFYDKNILICKDIALKIDDLSSQSIDLDKTEALLKSDLQIITNIINLTNFKNESTGKNVFSSEICKKTEGSILSYLKIKENHDQNTPEITEKELIILFEFLFTETIFFLTTYITDNQILIEFLQNVNNEVNPINYPQIKGGNIQPNRIKFAQSIVKSMLSVSDILERDIYMSFMYRELGYQ